MDAIKFLRTSDRICDFYDSGCARYGGCPLYSGYNCMRYSKTENYEKVITNVEEWLKGHPVDTFLEKAKREIPNLVIMPIGYPRFYPVDIGYCGTNGVCINCKYGIDKNLAKCWNVELEG